MLGLASRSYITKIGHIRAEMHAKMLFKCISTVNAPNYPSTEKADAVDDEFRSIYLDEVGSELEEALEEPSPFTYEPLDLLPKQIKNNPEIADRLQQYYKRIIKKMNPTKRMEFLFSKKMNLPEIWDTDLFPIAPVERPVDLPKDAEIDLWSYHDWRNVALSGTTVPKKMRDDDVQDAVFNEDGYIDASDSYDDRLVGELDPRLEEIQNKVLDSISTKLAVNDIKNNKSNANAGNGVGVDSIDTSNKESFFSSVGYSGDEEKDMDASRYKMVYEKEKNELTVENTKKLMRETLYEMRRMMEGEEHHEVTAESKKMEKKMEKEDEELTKKMMLKEDEMMKEKEKEMMKEMKEMIGNGGMEEYNEFKEEALSEKEMATGDMLPQQKDQDFEMTDFDVDCFRQLVQRYRGDGDDEKEKDEMRENGVNINEEDSNENEKEGKSAKVESQEEEEVGDVSSKDLVLKEGESMTFPFNLGCVLKVRYVDKKKANMTRRLSSALVCSGTETGGLAVGYARAYRTPDAVMKADEMSMNQRMFIELYEGRTIYSPVVGKFNQTTVKILPAKRGHGITGSDLMYGMLSNLGVEDAICKISGNTNPFSVVQAALGALSQCISVEEQALKSGRRYFDLNTIYRRTSAMKP